MPTIRTLETRIQSLEGSLPVTFRWAKGRETPPVDARQLVLWENEKDEEAVIRMRRSNKIYEFRSTEIGISNGYLFVKNDGGSKLTQRDNLQFMDGLNARDNSPDTEVFLDFTTLSPATLAGADLLGFHDNDASAHASITFTNFQDLTFTWTNTHDFTPSAATRTPITMTAFTGQSVPLVLVQDSDTDSTEWIRFSKEGRIGCQDSSPTARVSVQSLDFQPDDLSGMEFWFKADDLTDANADGGTLEEGAAITSWPDSANNGYDGTVDAQNAPLYVESWSNSKPSVHYTSGSKRMNLGQRPQLGDLTFFWVLQSSDAPNNEFAGTGIFLIYDNLGPTQQITLSNIGDDQDFEALEKGPDPGDIARWGNLIDSALDSPRVVVFDRTGKTWSSRLDGVDQGSDSDTNTDWTTNFARFLGDPGSAGVGAYLAEFIGYNRKLSETEIQQVEDYLYQKYNIAGGGSGGGSGDDPYHAKDNMGRIRWVVDSALRVGIHGDPNTDPFSTDALVERLEVRQGNIATTGEFKVGGAGSNSTFIGSLKETSSVLALESATGTNLQLGSADVPAALSMVAATGVYTFSAFPITPSSAPSADYEVANKKYVDDEITTHDVADEHIPHSSVILTAGGGLTGTGDITASRTFDVGAGTGITVNTDDVAVDLTHNFAWTGAHTHTQFPVGPSSAPSADYEWANKKYVDDEIAGTPGAAAGSDHQLQYNNAGSLAGIPSVTFDDATGDMDVKPSGYLELDPTGELRLNDTKSTSGQTAWEFESQRSDTLGGNIYAFKFFPSAGVTIDAGHTSWETGSGLQLMELLATTPQMKINPGHVAASPEPAIFILSDATGSPALWFGDDSDEDEGGLEWDAANQTLDFYAASKENLLRLNDTSNNAQLSLFASTQGYDYGMFLAVSPRDASPGASAGSFLDGVAGGYFLVTTGSGSKLGGYTEMFGGVSQVQANQTNNTSAPDALSDVWGFHIHPERFRAFKGTRTVTRFGGLDIGLQAEGDGIDDIIGIRVRNTGGTSTPNNDYKAIEIADYTPSGNVNAGIYINGALTANFRDDDLYLASDADGFLDMHADDAIRLNDGHFDVTVADSITATNPSAQAGAGSEELTQTVNRITTVTNPNDSVTLPPVSRGRMIYVANDDSTNAAEVYPASGDDLGAGTDTKAAAALNAGDALIGFGLADSPGEWWLISASRFV